MLCFGAFLLDNFNNRFILLCHQNPAIFYNPNFFLFEKNFFTKKNSYMKI